MQQKQEKKARIGLEVHGYLTTQQKLFCNCKAQRHTAKQNIKPNTNICPICTGQPGSKPMLPNKEAIEKLIQIALILNCKINPKLLWNRKHYNWPDLPKGYQETISGAYSIPFGESGNFESIKINECHLEEDPAAWNPETGTIDYNRSGLPLVEIATAPEFNSSEQVINWLKKIILSLSYIKAVDKNAGLKVDVNISINQKEGENRVEVKNITSLESIKQAIDFEIQRQQKEGTFRETRRFADGKTIKMRSKENLEDYRFIPDPDLPIIKITNKEIKEIKYNLPETPQQKLDKLIRKHKIDKKNAEILSQNLDLVEFFEKVSEKISPNFVLPWVTIELLRILNYNKKTLEEVEINPEHFIELLKLVKEGKITILKAKQILNDFGTKSFSPKAEGIAGKSATEKFVDEAIKNNNQAVQDFKQGKKESLNFLLGEVMKISKRTADFKLARELLLKKLK